jgi:hypothetical protein
MATQNNASAQQDQYDDSVPPLWESVAMLGAAVPVEEWDRLPIDLAANPDRSAPEAR